MFRQKSKKSISPSSRKSKENLNVSKCADNFTISCNPTCFASPKDVQQYSFFFNKFGQP